MSGVHPARWPTLLRVAFGFALTIGMLFLGAWIFIDAPTRTLLPLGVGAPEISAWLIVGSLVAIAVCSPGERTSAFLRWVRLAAFAALALAATPLARFAATARRAEDAMSAALGSEPSGPVPPSVRATMRPHPLAFAELFGVEGTDSARVAREIPVAVAAGIPLKMTVYQPAQAGMFPIVVQIYGGAWQRGEPNDNGEFARWLAARGYVVFAIDYRHAPASRWPAQLDDVKSDLGWIRVHAAEYGADTQRVALMGRSAGAHLAMMAGFTGGPLSVRAVVSYYGPVDLTDSYRNPPHPDPLKIRAVEETLIGATLDERPDAYREASPISYATQRVPPTLLVYGGRDHIVELRYARILRDQLVAAGNTAVLIDIPWADHAFDEVFFGPSSQLARYHTERFLAWAMAAKR